MRNTYKHPLVLSLVTLFILSVFTYLLLDTLDTSDKHQEMHPRLKNLTINPDGPYYYELKLPNETLRFNLVDPEQAPEDIRRQVKLGWKIMDQTQEYAKGYVGNALTCSNCHFSCGNTFGGKNGSISLVGAPSWYPEYSERAQKVLSLEDRIDNCFMRSLNGTPPPRDSKEMQAIVAYLTWISKEVAKLKTTPWRGLIPLTSHTPDPHNGKRIYIESCAPCHQMHGEGIVKEDATLRIPPVWGPQSYNDGAGMNQLKMLSSFIYYNMPFQQPTLSEEESLDVAAYVIQKPRPHFKKPMD